MQALSGHTERLHSPLVSGANRHDSEQLIYIATALVKILCIEFVVRAGGDSRRRMLTMKALEKETPRRTAANIRVTAAHLREERAHAISRIDDVERRVKLDVRADDGH